MQLFSLKQPTRDWALAERAWWGREIGCGLASQALHGGRRRQEPSLLPRDLAGGRLPLAVGVGRLVRRPWKLAKGDSSHPSVFGTFLGNGPVTKHRRARTAAGAAGAHISVPSRAALRPAARGWFGYRNYRLTLAAYRGPCECAGTNLKISFGMVDKSEPSVSSDWVYNSWWVPGMARPVWFPELRNWRPGDSTSLWGTGPGEWLRPSFNRLEFRCGSAALAGLTDGVSIVWARRFGPAAGLVAEQDAQVILRSGRRHITKQESEWTGKASIKLRAPVRRFREF